MRIDTLGLLLVAEYDRTDPEVIEALMRTIVRCAAEIVMGSAQYRNVHAKLNELLTARDDALFARQIKG